MDEKPKKWGDNREPVRDAKGRFVKGSGGRPQGTRNRRQASGIATIEELIREHGDAIETWYRVAMTGRFPPDDGDADPNAELAQKAFAAVMPYLAPRLRSLELQGEVPVIRIEADLLEAAAATAEKG